jgi:transcriptional regulator with XRE-family HTH domain
MRRTMWEADLDAFGAALAAARTRAGLSQKALGERADLLGPQASVSRYEAGRVEPPMPTVFALERALRVTPGSLSHYLGYRPVDAGTVDQVLPVVDAIQQDPHLNSQAKTMLIAAYRAATRR